MAAPASGGHVTCIGGSSKALGAQLWEEAKLGIPDGGLLAAILVFGGGAALVSQDFRDYVETSLAGALPGLTVGGCQIKVEPSAPGSI